MEKYDHEELLRGLEKNIRPYEGPGNVEFVDRTEGSKKCKDYVKGTRVWLCKRIKPENDLGLIIFNVDNREYEFQRNWDKTTGSGEMLDIAEFLIDIEAKLEELEHEKRKKEMDEKLRKFNGDQAGK